GGAAGLAIAIAARSLLVRLAADALPGFADLRIDRSVLLADGALSALAPIVFGLAPAMNTSRAEALNDRSDITNRRTRSTRNVLVACEVALSVILVVGAGLLVRSLVRLERVDPGFAPERVITFNVSLPSVRYPDDEHSLIAIEEIERRLRALPGVEAAGG